MRIHFDPDFDAGIWPGPLTTGAAAFGEAWMGPQRLLSTLETALGLGGVWSPEPFRVAAVVPKLRALEGFWSRSAEVDPIGTARALLDERDALWSAGWRGEPVAPRLGELHAVTDGAPHGTVDRMASVLDVLQRRGADIEELTLCRPQQSFPPAWRRVFAALASHGTRLVEQTLVDATATGDLAGARQKGFAPKADGSLFLLRAAGPLEAADEVAAWIGMQLAASPDASIVVVGSDGVLDRALHRHGLPTTGAPTSMLDNPLLQLLPLVLAMGWAPPDPARALELLTLPAGPVPGALRHKLRDAMGKAPAVDSNAWRKALQEGLELVPEDRRQRGLDAVTAIFTSTIPRSGLYPMAEIAKRAGFLQGWLRGCLDAKAGSEDPGEVGAYRAAVSQVSAFTRLLELSQVDGVSGPHLERFLENATLGIGDSPLWDAQAGLARVSAPGGVYGAADIVVWWPFTRRSVPPKARLALQPAERVALVAAGVELPRDGDEVVSQARAWRRPLLQARHALLLVCPELGEDGEPDEPHPLWDSVTASVADGHRTNALVVRKLAALDVARTARERLTLPKAQRTWSLPKGATTRRESAESPTSAAAFVGCSFQWAVQYLGRVYDSQVVEAGGERLFGTLAHEVLATVLENHKGTADDVEAYATRVFAEEGPRIAASLYLPGGEADRTRVEQATVRSARTLLHILQDAGAGVGAVEQRVEGQAWGAAFAGTPDLVTTKKLRLVLDFKWGGRTYRRTELEHGTAHQLASYVHLLENAGGADATKPVASVGYFIVNEQKAMLLQSSRLDPKKALPGVELVASDHTHAETWAGLTVAVEAQRRLVDSGRLIATGVPARDPDGDASTDDNHAESAENDDATDAPNAGASEPGPEDELEEELEEAQLIDGRLHLPPPCRFCSFDVLCGKASIDERAAAAASDKKKQATATAGSTASTTAKAKTTASAKTKANRQAGEP
jgi:CRISPR/Cas system-associated exonuclease Cas4 (RecB family)